MDAGGGTPQWNCAGGPCTWARPGEQTRAFQLQDRVALSGDRVAWYFLTESPPELFRVS
jgi:pyrroloquinoline quinone biosynthesis protein B